MSIKEISSKKLYKEYQVSIDYKEIDNSINSKIQEMIPTVSLPGFRKGKAPLNIVKKNMKIIFYQKFWKKLLKKKLKKF